MEISRATITKAGGRKYNEDYGGCFLKDGWLCAVLADGLGGHRGGQEASRTAVQQVLEAFGDKPECSAEALHAYFIEANRSLAAGQAKDSKLASMKTTMVIWVGNRSQSIWGHIGDSRLYHFRNHRVISCTKDHSLPQKLADIGEIQASEIRNHEDRNRLTAVMDGGDSMKWRILEKPMNIKPKDGFLLCTDGFWEYVVEKEMESDLKQSHDAEAWLKAMEMRLLERAPQQHDNYSAIGLMGI